jgi:hypothetical protein
MQTLQAGLEQKATEFTTVGAEILALNLSEKFLSPASCFSDESAERLISMARSSAAPAPAQVLLFPYGELAEPGEPSRPKSTAPERGTSVVLCGTYRKDPEGLRRTFERLKDTGFLVLSPSNPFIETEDQGFVYMRHEISGTYSGDMTFNRTKSEPLVQKVYP